MKMDVFVQHRHNTVMGYQVQSSLALTACCAAVVSSRTVSCSYLADNVLVCACDSAEQSFSGTFQHFRHLQNVDVTAKNA